MNKSKIAWVMAFLLVSVVTSTGCNAEVEDPTAEEGTETSSDALESATQQQFFTGCTTLPALKNWASSACQQWGWAGAKNREGLDRCSSVGHIPGLSNGAYLGIRFRCYK